MIFKEKTQVKDGILVSDKVTASLEGVTIAPQEITIEYSKRYDANVLYQFKAKNLKKIIDNIVKETLDEVGN